MECNNLIYCYEKKEHNIYEIEEIIDDNVSCREVGKYPVTFEEVAHLNWSVVGVFRKGGVSSNVTNIKTSQIRGKVLIVGKYLITCPINVPNEK